MAWKERQILTAYQTANRKIEKYVKEIERQYGYCADPNLPCWKNVENYMLQMSVSEWFARPTNMACHDYCKYNPMPPGLRSFLGNGLKYCVRRP